MKLIIATVVITLTAVVFGIFNRRWAVACAFFVLHIAFGGFIIGCMSHWASQRQQVAAPSRLHDGGKMHASVLTPQGIRG